MVIPILQTMLKGELVMPEVSAQQNATVSDFTEGQRKAVFWLGVGGFDLRSYLQEYHLICLHS